MNKIKFLFVVQGEGRGHMMQAIALQNMILNHGHEVCAVVVGKSERREIPSFFFEKIKCPIISIESPNFVTDENNKAINVGKTLTYNLARFGFYWKNVKKLDALVKEYKPNVVINFYEFLCGAYFLWFKPKNVKHVCIGHQYLIAHPEFALPEKVSKRDKFLYDLNTKITSSNAWKKLALSFRKMENVEKQKIYVVPPLLRQEVLALSATSGDYILVYMVNSGFADEVIQWHKLNTDVSVELFCDRKDLEDEAVFDGNMIIHKLNDQKFMEKMKNCKAYASTAGFESICEAIYLGKPVLLVPPAGHFEQSCNALDAILTGAGIESSFFDIKALLDYIPRHENKNTETFRGWVNSAEAYFSNHLFNLNSH